MNNPCRKSRQMRSLLPESSKTLHFLQPTCNDELKKHIAEMVDESQQKPAYDPPSLNEMEYFSESRTDDDSKTPIKPDRKRFTEGDSSMTDPALCQMLNQTIVKATKSPISEVMPEMNDRIKDNLLEAINKANDESIKQIRTEVEKVVSEKVESAERRCKLKTVFEDELLEFYNRWDNIRIVGVKEDRSFDNKISEKYSQSMQKVLQPAEKVGRNVASHNISIAHRRPSRKQSKERPIMVNFARRIAKMEISLKNKYLGTLQDLKQSIFLKTFFYRGFDFSS